MSVQANTSGPALDGRPGHGPKREREAKWFEADEAIANVHAELGVLIKTMHSRLLKTGKTAS